jgi:hypothetical protein
MLLAATCFVGACHFQAQHRQAVRVVSAAYRAQKTAVPPAPNLPNPEAYLLRAWWTFYDAAIICAFTAVTGQPSTGSGSTPLQSP